MSLVLATLALAAPLPATGNGTARPTYCHDYPVLATAKGAVKRAKKGWNARKVDKNGEAIRRVRIQSHCAPSRRGRRHVERAIDHARADYKKAKQEQDELLALTPYDCGSAGSWAIPCGVVACESGYSWSAANPSGAVGPYQLLGKGAPFPADTDAERLVHHKIASDLWAGGSGASHWEQCL